MSHLGQLYLPTFDDFKMLLLKELLAGRKFAYKRNEVKNIDVYRFPEFSVMQLMIQISDDADFLAYLPSAINSSK